MSAELEKFRKGGLVRSVAYALNQAALNVKKETMPKETDRFVKRAPTFFKANSKVQFAKGSQIAALESVVGFTPKNAGKGISPAVKELEQQETGGYIKHRDYTSLEDARYSDNWHKNVRLAYRLENIDKNKIINANKVKQKSVKRPGTFIKMKSKSQRFIRASLMAKKLYGDDAFVLGNKHKAGLTLSHIKKAEVTKSGKVIIERKAIYTVKDNRSVKVAGTNFMQRASHESGLKLEKYYIEEATRQVAKIKK